MYSKTRPRRPALAAALAAALLALVPAGALASAQGVVLMKKWQMADKCAAQAHAAFPDYTPQANAQRDARMQQCLNSQNLPTREESEGRR